MWSEISWIPVITFNLQPVKLPFSLQQQFSLLPRFLTWIFHFSSTQFYAEISRSTKKKVPKLRWKTIFHFMLHKQLETPRTKFLIFLQVANFLWLVFSRIFFISTESAQVSDKRRAVENERQTSAQKTHK